MKTISEYLDIAFDEVQLSRLYKDFHGEEIPDYVRPILWEKTFDLAMQLSKQDHDKEMADYNSRIKRSQPASDKQLNYIRNLSGKNEENGQVLVRYLNDKDCTLPKLSENEASELIELLLKEGVN